MRKKIKIFKIFKNQNKKKVNLLQNQTRNQAKKSFRVYCRAFRLYCIIGRAKGLTYTYYVHDSVNLHIIMCILTYTRRHFESFRSPCVYTRRFALRVYQLMKAIFQFGEIDALVLSLCAWGSTSNLLFACFVFYFFFIFYLSLRW